MKSLKILFTAAFSLMAMATMAQQDFSDPRYARYGDTPEQREQNILRSNFLKEAVQNKDYNLAALYFQLLHADRPKVSVNIYKYGAIIYRNKINRAKSVAEKKTMVDSLLAVYDARVLHFGDSAKEGKAYILDVKARDVLNFMANNRAAIRQAFREAIEAGGAQTNPETIVVFFSNLCDDYQNTDEVMPEEIIAEYDRLTPFLEAHPTFKEQFDAAFGRSGAADCENLEKLFRAKLAAAPEDAEVLNQAVTLMTRANCQSDFYFEVAEKSYAVQPTAQMAIYLAQSFKNKGDYDKASKYLNASLATEENPEERQKLLTQISVVELVANNISAAAKAAKEAMELNPEDGVPVFVLAQCYGISASNCGEQFARQAACWVAYDTMSKAVDLLQNNPEYLDTAKQAQAAFRSRFPSQEECFMRDLQAGNSYRVDCGLAAGITTTVRPR
ncbi:MAG: enzyme of heme biosynthesis [Alistipes sp.]|nr:enzyme of heme biosynthesis [Alistipes sp.]MBQ8470377.1 enzyme of heme biosynthesis [Alistipes sp.]